MIIMDMTTKVFNDDVVQPLIEKYFSDESFIINDRSREGHMSIFIDYGEHRLNIYHIVLDEMHTISISKDRVVSTEYRILSHLGDFKVFTDILNPPITLTKNYPYESGYIIDKGTIDDLKSGVDKIFEDFYLMV